MFNKRDNLAYFLDRLSLVYCVEQRRRVERDKNLLKLCFCVDKCTPHETQYREDSVSVWFLCICPDNDSKEQQEGIPFVL